eukprot:TRINITY_DN5434_c0_g1_i1.p1 TRINITY_DN5434_c0_g1~~TRINITY_DN5434_c0_g1_i1.p1  ORF type:complete len:533 (-),score=106.27 TRINITY_DN5434_c0_g1_i1:178-1776(-)
MMKRHSSLYTHTRAMRLPFINLSERPDIVESIMSNKHLTALDLFDCSFNVSALHSLSFAGKLERLSFSAKTPTSHIDHLSSVRTFILTCPFFLNLNTLHLTIKSSLSLSHAQILFNLNHLHDFELVCDNNFSLFSVCHFPLDSALRVLSTVPCDVAIAQKLSLLSSLSSLSFFVPRTYEGPVADLNEILMALSSSSTLQHITIQRIGMTISTCVLSELTKRLHLQSLTLQDGMQGERERTPILESGWSASLLATSSLTHLSLTWPQLYHLDECDMQALCSSKYLTSFAIDDGFYYHEEGDKLIGKVLSIRSLRDLQLRVHARHLPSSSLRLLADQTITHLEHFSLSIYDDTLQNNNNTINYEMIASIPSLSSLQIYPSSPLSNTVWYSLGRHPQLHSLSVLSSTACERRSNNNQKDIDCLDIHSSLFSALNLSTSLLKLQLRLRENPSLEEQKIVDCFARTLVVRNRASQHNWCCIALLIAFYRANRPSVLRNTLLYTLQQIMSFIEPEDAKIVCWKSASLASTTNYKRHYQ